MLASSNVALIHYQVGVLTEQNEDVMGVKGVQCSV